MRDERGRYSIVRKEYPNGQVFYIFSLLSGEEISPLRDGSLRIELKRGTNFEEVKRFEAWLNLNIEAVAYTRNEDL